MLSVRRTAHRRSRLLRVTRPLRKLSVANNAVVAITTTPANRLVSSSLALQQAVVNAPDGDVTNQTVVTFTNQTTRTGTIEICKFGLDTDVAGFFNFTVQGAPGQTFSVPVGFCSGPITVTLLQVNAGPSPSPTQAFTTWMSLSLLSRRSGANLPLHSRRPLC